MSRPAMIAMVCLAAYCLLDLAVSLFVAMLWRTRIVASAHLPPTVRARRVMLLRITPAVMATAITLLIVGPAFALFEPRHEEEAFGPFLAMLSGVTLAHLVFATITAARRIWITRQVEREWLRSSSPLVDTPGLQAFAIDAASPVAALVGVFTPKLVAARSVIECCTADEIKMIIGHERGHFESRDNFKRWLMASLPDTLRLTSIHREMLEAWHQAAEDAADDAATRGDEERRADLAALLLKVARLAPNPLWRSAVVSPFVECDGLERRVRRLLRPELEPPAPIALLPMLAVAIIAAAVVVTLWSPAMLKLIFTSFENLVAFGR